MSDNLNEDLNFKAIDIANYFLFLQNNKFKNEEIKKIDKWKLQKLLYYSQGYYCAIYNKFLFKEKMIKYYYGPYCEEINKTFKTDSNYFIIDKGKNNINNEEIMFFLETIFLIKKNKTGKDLVEDSHHESPYENTCFQNEISLQIFKQEFCKFKHLCYFFKEAFRNDFKKNSKFLLLFKKKIRNSLLSETDTIVDIDFDITEKSQLDKSLLSELYFPNEIENNLDILNSLYSRQYIHQELAGSAKYGNARAFFHLSQCFQNSFICEKNEKFEKFEKWLLEQAKEKAKNDIVLLSWIENSITKKKEILENSKFVEKPEFVEKEDFIKKQEGERLFYLGLFKRKRDECLSIFQKSYQYGYKRAKLEIAKREEKYENAYKIYLEMGKDGIPDGYFNAAMLIEQKKVHVEESAEELYLKAGKMGKTQGFLKVMEIQFNQNAGPLDQQKEDNLEKLATKMKKKGDLSGFRKLGDWYRKKGELDKAKDFYIKAGKFIGYHLAAEIEEDNEKKQKLLSDANEYTILHFEGIANFLYPLFEK